jgi:hypothetical protein
VGIPCPAAIHCHAWTTEPPLQPLPAPACDAGAPTESQETSCCGESVTLIAPADAMQNLSDNASDEPKVQQLPRERRVIMR